MLKFTRPKDITTPSKITEKPTVVWSQLPDPDKELLKAYYGEPRFLSTNVCLTAQTRGAYCSDNEHAIPASTNNKNYGIWKRAVTVYALYSEGRSIKDSTLMRAIPGGMVVGINGGILLPSYFYTPRGSLTRRTMIDQIRSNPFGDKSLRLGPTIEVSIHRRIGKHMGVNKLPEVFGGALYAREERLALTSSSWEKRYRKSLEVLQNLFPIIDELVTASNEHLVKEAFAGELEQEVRNVTLPESVRGVFFSTLDRAKTLHMGRSVFEDKTISFRGTKDPTWKYGDESRPYVFEWRYLDDEGEKAVEYVYSGDHKEFEYEAMEESGGGVGEASSKSEKNSF